MAKWKFQTHFCRRKLTEQELQIILNNRFLFRLFSCILEEDKREEKEPYEYVAMFANPELFAKAKGYDSASGEVSDYYLPGTIRRSDNPELRNEEIGKDFKQIFQTDLKSYLKTWSRTSRMNSRDEEYDDDILELNEVQ